MIPKVLLIVVLSKREGYGKIHLGDESTTNP
jgi:hypothetical protein